MLVQVLICSVNIQFAPFGRYVGITCSPKEVQVANKLLSESFLTEKSLALQPQETANLYGS